MSQLASAQSNKSAAILTTLLADLESAEWHEGCAATLARTAFALRQQFGADTSAGQQQTAMAVNEDDWEEGNWPRVRLLVQLGMVNDCRMPQWLAEMGRALVKKQHFQQTVAILAARLEWVCLACLDSSSLPSVCTPRPAFLPPRRISSSSSSSVRGVPSLQARAEACARVDVAGGWTDTPPITYQMGPETLPAVLSLSIRVNGKRPIRCRCARLEQFQGVYSQEKSAGHLQPMLVSHRRQSLTFVFSLTCQHFASADRIFANCNRPSEPGSLLCAVLVVAGLVREQLRGGERRRFFSFGGPGRGLLIKTESDLPHGSGLGSSSILSAALLAALARLRGHAIEDTELLHSVLQVEQLHTTGGGWQDQMGGCLAGGAKLGWVSPEGMRQCCYRAVPLGGQLRQQLAHRLVLVYTGQTRLAKTLLQEVLLSWARAEPGIRQTVAQLAEGARQAEKALLNGQFPGKNCEEYNELKKRFARNTEPPLVSEFKAELRKRGLAEIAWMAGAGGGGFLYVWLAEGVDAGQVEALLATEKQWNGMSLWRAELETLRPLEIQ